MFIIFTVTWLPHDLTWHLHDIYMNSFFTEKPISDGTWAQKCPIKVSRSCDWQQSVAVWACVLSYLTALLLSSVFHVPLMSCGWHPAWHCVWSLFFILLYTPVVMTWTSRKLDATSRSHGNTRWVMPIHMGCKSDGLGFSYMGLVSCTFLAVLCLLFQRQIWSASMTTRLRSVGVCSCWLSD